MPKPIDRVYHLMQNDAVTACGKTIIPGDGLTRVKESVSCLNCRLSDMYLSMPPKETAGRPAVNVRHFAQSSGGGYTRCGMERSGQVTPTTDFWGLVTCPDCLNFHSRESEIRMSLNDHKLQQQQETQERITAAHRHDWWMDDGPTHQHDCEECIFLGKRRFSGVIWDLYHCSQSVRPTVIARRGPGGDYESGMEFVDKIAMLALAYVRAIKAGLVQG